MNRAESRISHATRVDLIKLKQLRENVKWEDMEDRRKFLQEFYVLIRYWIGELPDLRNIFRREEIEWLFTEPMTIAMHKAIDIVDFAIKTGYKDDAEPHQVRRATPVHRAAYHSCRYETRSIVARLFRIYDRFDVNCTDELGLTHFHVACEYACYDVVEKFFELGRVDPDLALPKTGDTPLHLVLTNPLVYVNEVLVLLLARGANPNLSNAEGSTPLHVICKGRAEDSKAAEILFDLSDDKYRPVRVDARDKFGRTPLQWAVAKLFSDTVEVLLDNVDDLSSFDFPTQSHFDECLGGYSLGHDEELHANYLPIHDLMHIVNCLERRGYAIDRSDASTIVKIFTKFGVFKRTPDLDEYLRSDKEFVECAKQMTIKPSLSLHDLLQVRPVEKAAKLCTVEDHSRIWDPVPLWWLKEAHRRALMAHLNEIQLRGFCRRWALDDLAELTRLPILCCDRVCDFLMNEDLLRICRAAEIDDDEQS